MATGPRGHPSHQFIGSIEDSPAVRAESLDDFALGPGDDLTGSELAQVGGPDVEDHGDVGGDDGGQPRNVAESASPHLGDEECGLLVDAACR